MHENPIAPFDQTEPHNRVCVVDGYGIKLHVRQGHLIVEDGIGRQRRIRRFHKATANLDRLVLVAHSGYLTIEAIRWLTDICIGLIHLDPDGNLLTSTAAPTGHNPKLRRAQATAATQPIGLHITRHILRNKILAQAHVAAHLPTADTADLITATIGDLDQANTLDQLRLVEATAALVYWNAWTEIPISYVKADLPQIPDHWHQVGPRRSPVSGNQRLAANPAHAILNYLYALLEAEARIACATAGLDPAIGILHTDQAYRDSLAYDVMEPARPNVDQYVLDLLDGHRFRARDFIQTQRGSCRIGRTLAHKLAETTTTWGRHVAPTVEEVTKALSGKRRSWERPTPTRLTQTNRQTGRNTQRRNQKTQTPQSIPKPDGNCADCGTTIPKTHRRCNDCNNTFQAERMPDVVTASWTSRRATGEDPAHGSEAARKRGETSRRENLASAEWDRTNERPDKDTFTREILPGLETVTVTGMAQATGLSTGYCSMIKRGTKIPHPRHWPALIRLITGGHSV